MITDGLVFCIISVICTGFGGSGSQVDSARMNLASSFVNGFVNAAFGQDKLLTDDGNKWLYKNKDHGKRTHAFLIGTLEPEPN